MGIRPARYDHEVVAWLLISGRPQCQISPVAVAQQSYQLYRQLSAWQTLGDEMNLTDEERKAVRDEGIIAALRDKSATECPYPEDDERHALWIDGHRTAEPHFDK